MESSSIRLFIQLLTIQITQGENEKGGDYELCARAIGVFAYWQINKRRGRTGDEIQQVNIEKIFQEHRDLRPEDQQALQFLTENHGRAYEAELYEKLNLPRTSTWRLIKRLEKMEIVDITKSRRQNVVHIRPEYLS